MLEYDDSAFYYFALTFVCLYLIPGLWYAIAEFLRAYGLMSDSSTSITSRTSIEREKTWKLKNENTGTARLKRWPFLVNLFFVTLALFSFAFLVSEVRSHGEVSRFDPYTILGIEHGASVSEIKKAYRKMSLKYHPDKNVGNKQAEEMFVKVTKAHEALTDEVSKENYEKFGNPDGKQSLEVSIGLPKIILENPKVVLVLYLIVIVVIIPIAVGLWYSYSKQFGEKNVKHETYGAFVHYLTERHKAKNISEVLAVSAEHRRINQVPRPGASEDEAKQQRLAMSKIFGEIKDKVQKPLSSDLEKSEAVIKGNVLLTLHLNRLVDKLASLPALQNDLDQMLKISPDLIEGLIEIACQRDWVTTAIECIRYSQCLLQAVPNEARDDPFKQIPHLEENGGKLGVSFVEFIRDPKSSLSKLKDLTPEQVKDIEAACRVIPHVKIEERLYVEEEDEDEGFYEKQAETEVTKAATTSKKNSSYNYNPNKSKSGKDIKGGDIYEGDVVTLKVTLSRENITESERCSPVHAPFYPRVLNEVWWLLLTEPSGSKTAGGHNQQHSTKIKAVERITDTKRVVTHELRFQAPMLRGRDVETHSIELNVLSESYLGLDVLKTIKFDVHSAEDLPEYQPHPEDVELDNEPTLFEQVMAANMDQSSSDDDDDDDDNDGDGGGGKRDDDDEDDDDD